MTAEAEAVDACMTPHHEESCKQQELASNPPRRKFCHNTVAILFQLHNFTHICRQVYISLRSSVGRACAP